VKKATLTEGKPGRRVDHDGTYDGEGWQYSINFLNSTFSGR